MRFGTNITEVSNQGSNETVSMQSRQVLCCSHMQSMDVDEDSDYNLDI